MHANATDCLLVCDDGRLIGIFTDRDAVVKVAGKRLAAFDVRDFMTPDPVVLRPGDTLAVAIHKMAVGEFRHVPIVDADSRPIGVVSAADVFRHIVASLG
jgi:CBS domain-containing protein